MNWAIFLLMLPHLKPKCLKHLWPELYLAFDVARVVSLLVLVGLFVYRIVKAKPWHGADKRWPAALLRSGTLPSPIVWVLGALEGWICLIALLKDGDYVETFSLAVSVLAIALLVDFYSDRVKELLTSLMLNYEWVVYANLVTVLMRPNVGITYDPEYKNMPIYFFGPDNWFMYLCVPAVCVALLYLRLQLEQERKIDGIMRAVYLIAASYACVFLQWPVTAVVAMAVIVLILLVSLVPGVRYCVVFPVVLVCGAAADLAIPVFRITETVPWIAEFIQTTLKKDVSFSGRTSVWDGFQEMIKGHLLTGIGTPKEGYLIGGQYMDHMHNQPFDLLAQGGIPALLLFLAVLFLAGKALIIHFKTPSARIMTAVMAGLFVICIPEVCRHASIFLLFPLAYHVGKAEAACQHEISVPGSSEV